MHMGSIIIPDLQWWQALTVIVVGLGLSPAPWMTGLALGRIQFSAPTERATALLVKTLNDAHELQIKSLNAAHALQLSESDAGWQRSYNEVKDSRNTYLKAWENERDGRAEATTQLGEVAKAAGNAAAVTVAAVTDATLKPKEDGA